MKVRLCMLALGAALVIWSATAVPTAAQDKQPSHNDTNQKAPMTHEQIMERMRRMSPEERQKFHEEMAKHGQMGGRMHGPGGHGSHDAPNSNSGTRPVPLSMGEKGPDFTMKDLQGTTQRLSDLRKQSKTGIVSLTFWCTFCHSCRDMEARLDGFAQDHNNQAVVAAIDASAGETAPRIAAFARKTGLNLPLLIDALGKAADLFGVKLTTTTVVIDGAGRLRYRGQYLAGGRMLAEDALNAVLAGKPVAMKETPQRG